MAQSEPSGAVGYIDRVLIELELHAPQAVRRGGESAVHRARVATRRMGAAIGVIKPLIGKRKRQPLPKALKQIRRSVQTLRDLDVMEEHLGQLQRAKVYPVACQMMCARIAEERRQTSRQVAQDNEVKQWLSQVGTWKTIRQSLLNRQDEIQGLIREALLCQFGEFGAQADRLSQALLGGTHEHQVEPHALRIAGKSLRYTFEMAQAEQMGDVARALKLFKQLQDALGFWHDYHVLCTRVLQACEAEMDKGEWRMEQRNLLLLAVSIHRESAKCLGQFARLWRKHCTFLREQLATVAGQAQGSAVAASRS